MAQEVMSEYRAKKMEEEYYERTTFPRPCELMLKHGKSRDIYWGRPEVIGESSKEIEGERMNMMSLLWKTKRDKPVYIGLLMPHSMKLESLMVPCKYMETDRGYKTVNALVIGSLALMNMVSFWMLLTMAEVGADAFTSPLFLMSLSSVLTLIVVAWRYNQTHFTYRLSIECFEPDKERGMAHFGYAVDCDIPVHRQLAWVNAPKDLLQELIEGHQDVLNETHLETRTAVGETNAKINDILRDRGHEVVLEANRSSVMNPKMDFWSSPAAWAMGVGLLVVSSLVVYLLIGG